MDCLQLLEKFEIAHLIQLVVVGFFFIYWSHRLMVRLEERIDKQIQRMDLQIENQRTISNDQITKQAERIDKQTERSDRLYEMFIDLLKETKKTKGE